MRELYRINPCYIYSKNIKMESIIFQNNDDKKIINLHGEKTRKYLFPYIDMFVFGIEITDFISSFFIDDYAQNLKNMDILMKQLCEKRIFIKEIQKDRMWQPIVLDLTREQNIECSKWQCFNDGNKNIILNLQHKKWENSEVVIVTDNILKLLCDVEKIIMNDNFNAIVWVHCSSNNKIYVSKIQRKDRVKFLKLCANFMSEEMFCPINIGDSHKIFDLIFNGKLQRMLELRSELDTYIYVYDFVSESEEFFRLIDF